MEYKTSINLKSEIEKTETLKNNASNIKNNINKTLNELGGTSASTFSEVPSRIKEVTDTFMHIADLTLNNTFELKNYLATSFSIPINVSFDPKIIYYEIMFDNPNRVYGGYCWAIDEYSSIHQEVRYDDTPDGSVLMDPKTVNRNSVEFLAQNDGRNLLKVTFKKMVIIG